MSVVITMYPLDDDFQGGTDIGVAEVVHADGSLDIFELPLGGLGRMVRAVGMLGDMYKAAGFDDSEIPAYVDWEPVDGYTDSALRMTLNDPELEDAAIAAFQAVRDDGTDLSGFEF